MRRLRTIARSLADLWQIVGIAILLFAALEAALSLAFAVRSTWHPPAPNFRGEADTYVDHAWSTGYYKELDAFERSRGMRWRPYVYWRRPPYQGTYINITADGLRQTIQASRFERPSETKGVFMFGGSTMWGLGVDDQSTIPSLVAKEITAAGGRVDVRNFGQYAYVSTQGVIELLLQLQRGNVPDVVIFCDGVNDTFGAFQLGVPGFPYEEFLRERNFNLSFTGLASAAAQRASREMSVTRFVDGSLERLGLRGAHAQSLPLEYDKPFSDRGLLANAVADTYLTNVKFVHALSQSYGFTALFYWQPVIYLKRHLTEYERRSIELEANYPGMKDFYLATYAALQQRAAAIDPDIAFHDISAIFRDVREPIFVDFNHMGEKGNLLIARRIANDLTDILNHPQSPTRRKSHEIRTGQSARADLFDLSAVERR